ncbi:DeoR/GlpR transcriptional regulator [Dactylosporangium aurantiacum]|uniref:DeoR/GlpR transcriptional regulator n=1 Tax=Dactylosporangium aurantiacum TaxID=35754 RepID=A0A9Q9IF14_9ACTN|nr:DeoR/GlpR family DNA-binding transcription regulator [Dactylosporangium aurantiacum]MDG6110094.1 DeoR/GlpR family DNA-binding transcription regulator [Dactylosporangium aurantiacum]UWZ51345.1 DeoR/GlpR transcriptional regulator [Dactylosporangium aurantiacum]
MLARQRQEIILDLVRRDGGVRLRDLMRRLGVSDMTVRRDLEDLAGQGLVEKVHGGATLPAGGVPAAPAAGASAVAAIARQAVALVEPGAAIALSNGALAAGVAEALADRPATTVVTNSLRVAGILHGTRHTVVLLGGVREASGALVGPVAEAAAGGLNVDAVFLDAHGVTVRAGFTAGSLAAAGVERRLVASARRLVVLAGHTRWGVTGIATVAALDDADVVITDEGVADDAYVALTDHAGRLIVAS